MQAGGVASKAVMAPMVDPNGAFTKVQERTLKGYKAGGKITKAKSGGSFPDLNKDGKITKADILKGRGVIAKKGASVKKSTSSKVMKAKPAMKKMMGGGKCRSGC